MLVEATSSTNANLFAAVNYANSAGAKIVSMSFGGTDSSSDNTYNADFEHAGVTYIASAGDTAAAVEYPAASPYVLAGGRHQPDAHHRQRLLQRKCLADSGGGISKAVALPAYQKSYGISNSGRSIPDVAWDAYRVPASTSTTASSMARWLVRSRRHERRLRPVVGRPRRPGRPEGRDATYHRQPHEPC